MQQAQSLLSDWRWRLNNLYSILDEKGRKIPFRLNAAQEKLFDELHFSNLILKARQRGFTTFIQIFMLDKCVFEPNIRAGTVAHGLHEAQTIFRDKVKLPYDSLPDGIKAAVPPVRDSALELQLANNSVMSVGTSHRSGTLQYLHISEYGKLCARYPEKAREVRTGSLNTVAPGQVVFVESTAEGQEGHFFELCDRAQQQARMGSRLTPLDFKFFFFPWHDDPRLVLDPEGVDIPAEMARYFERLEVSNGIHLSAAQKAWYVKKHATQLGDMKREYPSTPKEAFEAAVEGAYYGELLERAEMEGRVGKFAADPAHPVHTAWDIARGEYTSIWFWQRLPGRRVRLVGFFQDCLQGLPYYAERVKRLYEQNGWKRPGAIDWVHHDARVTEWGTNRSRIEQMFAKSLTPQIAPELSLADGINAVRAVLPLCEFDIEGVGEGLQMLRSYRTEWDAERGVWKDRPRHDKASHGSDAMRYLAVAYRELVPPPETPAEEKARAEKERPRGVEAATVNELLKLHRQATWDGRHRRI